MAHGACFVTEYSTKSHGCATFPSPPCVELDLRSIVEKLGREEGIAQEDRRDFAWQSFSISPYQTVRLDDKSKYPDIFVLGEFAVNV